VFKDGRQSRSARGVASSRPARSALASVTLTFDLLAQSLTGATATFGSPKLPG
jgi:hypothetical protein